VVTGRRRTAIAGRRPGRNDSRPFPWRPIAAILALLAVSDAVWLARDTRPPRWDESVHLLAAEKIRQAPPGQELAVAMSEPFYPPLVPALGAGIAMVFGPSDDAYAATMLVFLAVLVAATYGVAAREFGVTAGLLAAALTGASPLMTRETHLFLLDIPLAAMVMLTIWFVTADGLATTGRACGAGAVAGLAQLTKWTAIIYLIAPVAAMALRAVRRDGARQAGIRVGWFTGTCVLVCGSWYAANGWTIWNTGWRAAYLDAAVAHAPLFSLDVLALYPRVLLWGAPVAAGLFLAAALGLWRRGSHRWLLGAIVVPLVVLGGLRNKNDRYALPLIPQLAVGAGAVFAGQGRRARHWATAGVLACAGLLHTATAFGWPSIPRLESPPRPESWPLEAMLRAVAANEAGAASLAVIADHPYLNPSNVILTAFRSRLGVEVRGFEGAPSDSRFCLVKTGDPGAGAVERWIPARRDLTRELLAGTRRGRLYRVWRRWRLPDGSDAVLLRRR